MKSARERIGAAYHELAAVQQRHPALLPTLRRCLRLLDGARDTLDHPGSMSPERRYELVEAAVERVEAVLSRIESTRSHT